MSKSGFGERLKRDRELRGVSRDQICMATRISPVFLEALESERWEKLPGGIFNRGFLRAVARYLGVNEDDLITQYDLAISEKSKIEASPTSPVTEEAPKAPRRTLALLGTFGAILLLATGSLVWRSRQRSLPQSATSNDHTVSAGAATGQPEGSASIISVEKTDGSASLAANLLPSGIVSEELELKIEAGKETAVSVSTDGSKVFEGNMIAGQSRKFTAREAIDISAKDSGALLLELNGQTLAPLGPPGQPGNVTLTRNDLKLTDGGAN